MGRLTADPMRRRMRRSVGLSGALLACVTTTAVAGVSPTSVRIIAPASVTSGQQLNSTVHGVATTPLQLDYFAAYKPCAKTPAKEEAIAVGHIAYQVQGVFTHPVLTPALTQAGFLCAYLSKGVNPEGVATGAVQARTSRPYSVVPTTT